MATVKLDNVTPRKETLSAVTSDNQCHYVAEALEGPASAIPCALCARFYAVVMNVFYTGV